MKNKVYEYIRYNNLINKKEKVLIALSGGPDSVVMMHILNELKDKLNIELIACHINHNLRGNESNEDERFVHELCNELGIKIYSKSFDVIGYAKNLGLGIEEAAREIRYAYFKEIKELEGIDKIAIAHNMNDQCETMIHRFIRGSGLRGLSGISPIREDIYIRPILNLKRSEIEEYIKENNLNVRIDKSNYSKEYTRNRIRLEVIPYIEKNLNPNIVTNLNTMSVNMREDNDFIEKYAKAKFLEHCKILKDYEVQIGKELFLEHISIIKRVLFIAIEKINGSRKNITSGYLKDIIDLSKNETGKMINISSELVVSNVYGDLKIKKNNENSSLKSNKGNKSNDNNEVENISDNEEIKLNILKEPMSIIFNDYIITMLESTNDNPVKGFIRIAMDNMDSNVVIRNRREGDRIKPLGMKNFKKIKSIFIDKKIERDLRDKLPIIENSNGEIIYLHPNIISENYKVKSDTEKVLLINIIQNK